jgi:hypothetical protein
MGYREDLEAAMARVAALESELRRAQDGAAAEAAEEQLRQASAERDSARKRASELEKALTRAQRRLEKLEQERRKELREQAREEKPPVSIKGMPSLFDHNRSQAPLSGQGAGVLCPRCLAAGERVEMKVGKLGIRMAQEHVQQVWCPRCAEVGWKRG